MYLETVTIKIDEELKRSMAAVKENWSAYLREAIRNRVECEERKRTAEKLLSDLKAGKRRVPKGFVNSVIRETRESG
jgi:predicted transcriptional regulator